MFSWLLKLITKNILTFGDNVENNYFEQYMLESTRVDILKEQALTITNKMAMLQEIAKEALTVCISTDHPKLDKLRELLREAGFNIV